MGGDRSWGGSSTFPRNAVVACGEEMIYGEEEEDDDVVSVDLPNCQPERDNSHLLVRKGHTFPMTSSHSLSNLVFREPIVGEGQVAAETVEREQGGARGNQAGSQIEPRVADLEDCDVGGYVEGEDYPIDKVKGGGRLVGPSALDYLVQNDEVDGDAVGVRKVLG
jgi:hypothetical protein